MKVRKFLRRCFLFTLIDKIIHSSFLASFSKSVGFRTSLRQLLWRVFGPPLQHTDIFISTGVGQSNLKLPTPTSPTDYTCSSTSQVATSLHTDSSTTSPDSDCGLEMKSGPVETPSIESHPDTNPSLRRRKTHPPQTATTWLWLIAQEICPASPFFSIYHKLDCTSDLLCFALHAIYHKIDCDWLHNDGSEHRLQAVTTVGS